MKQLSNDMLTLAIDALLKIQLLSGSQSGAGGRFKSPRLCFSGPGKQ